MVATSCRPWKTVTTFKDDYAVNMIDALELISACWNKVNKETVINCFIKANCMPSTHVNEIMKLTEKGLARLAASVPATTNAPATLVRANSATGAAGTAGEVLEQVDAADAELAATVQPTEDELDTIIKKLDRIALTVTLLEGDGL